MRARGERVVANGAVVLEGRGGRDLDRRAADWRRDWLVAGGRVRCGLRGLVLTDPPATAPPHEALRMMLTRPGMREALARLVAHPAIADPAMPAGAR